MASKIIKVDAKDAINLTEIPAINNTKVVLPKGKYAVTFKSTMHYSGDNLLNQIIVFTTAPITSKNYDEWFFVPTTEQGTIVDSDGSNPIYVFTVDQLNISDNYGSAEVLFTQIS